jgi:hypothetical protein
MGDRWGTQMGGYEEVPSRSSCARWPAAVASPISICSRCTIVLACSSSSSSASMRSCCCGDSSACNCQGTAPPCPPPAASPFVPSNMVYVGGLTSVGGWAIVLAARTAALMPMSCGQPPTASGPGICSEVSPTLLFFSSQIKRSPEIDESKYVLPDSKMIPGFTG